MNSAIQKYFDECGDTYSNRSTRGFWGGLRKRELAHLAAMLPPGSLGRVLELGCGSGFYSQRLLYPHSTHLTCVDFSPVMLKNLPLKGVRKIESDIDSFYLNEKFDLVFCAGALEFVKDPLSVFTRVSEMLRPRHAFILLTARRSLGGYLYRWYHRTHGFSIHLFDLPQVKKLATESGFELAQIDLLPPFNFAIKLVKLGDHVVQRPDHSRS